MDEEKPGPEEGQILGGSSNPPEGAIVGARKRPDGTLDVSHGLIAIPEDPVKAKEVSNAIRANIP